MVIGLGLISWDDRIGAVLEVKYPETFEIPKSLEYKIYLTHSYNQDFNTDEIIEINYEDQIIISYCDKSKVPSLGYETIVLIIHAKEQVNSYNLKKQLIDFARNVFDNSKEKRDQIFLENADTFFKETSANKILLLGRAGTGKSTIKKIIFEGYDPKDLLYNPLEPTRGIAPSVYSWLDLNLGLFDTSGQELQSLLKDEKEQMIAFENADTIVYIFDYQAWSAKSQEIISEIQFINDIIKKKFSASKLILFLHKIDLLIEKSRELEIKKITETIKKKLNLPIYCTSIYPNLIYSLYNAFYEILSNFSEETTILKEIVDKNIKKFSKLMCFITDQNNSIIIQTMTNDFNSILINKSHKLIAQITHTFEDMSKNEINHLMLSSLNKFNITMINLNLLEFNIKNLICISEDSDINALIVLGGQMQVDLNRYLYFNKIN